MTDYRGILRLKSLGFSERNLALNCSCSRNTVSSALRRAKELGIAWPLGLKTVAETQWKRAKGHL